MFGFHRASSVVKQATRPVIEGLETRQMLSATLSTHGALAVTGTAGNDAITVSLDAHKKGVLDVSVNGKIATFTAAKVKSVTLNGLAGNDKLSVASTVTTPATLLGGAGNDTLVAGGGHDFMDGGTGIDNSQFSSKNGILLNDPSIPSAVVTGLTSLALPTVLDPTTTLVQVFHDDGQTYYGTVVTVGTVNTRLVVNAAGLPVTDSSGPGHGEGDHAGAFGTVTATTPDIAANPSATPPTAEVLATITISVTSEHGAATSKTFNVSDAAVITVNGNTVALASLVSPMVVAVHISPTDPTLVTSITAVNKHAEGIVTATTGTPAPSITIQSEHGTPTTYAIPAGVPVDLNGTAVTDLTTIPAGSHAEIVFSALDGTTILAVHLGQGEHGGPGEGHSPHGTFVSSTPTTITLQGDSVTPTIYTLGASFTVSVNGAIAPLGLAALTPGMDVRLTLAADGSVTAIDARTGEGHDGTEGHFVSATPAAGAVAGTIVLQGDHGPTTYTLAATFTVTVDGVSSALGLGALTPGMNVKLTQAADGTVTAIDARTNNGGPGHDHGPQGVLAATPTALDTTITLNGDHGAPTTYKLAATYTVTLDGAVVPLITALKAGDDVKLTLAADGSVTAIDARSPEVPQPEGVLAATPLTNTDPTISLQGDHGAPPTVFTLGATYSVTLDGAAAVLTKLTAGMDVRLTLSADGLTVVAIQAHTHD